MLTLYWYPKCSTCKKAKLWLDQQHESYELVDMIETPPKKDQIINWMNTQDFPIRRFFNTSGIKYREQKLKDIVPTLSKEEAAERLSQDGMLIKRPILVGDTGIILGFKESDYQEFFSSEGENE